MQNLLWLAALAGSAMAGDFTVKIKARQNNEYPPPLAVPTADQTPKEWLDALNAAVAAGKIPNIAPAQNQDGNVVYAGNAGLDPNTCSWTVTKCLGANDIVHAPPHQIAVSFDDGPTGKSGDLYDFLHQNQQSATHFMIGSNVLNFHQQFQHAVREGNQHFAVHTWSHQLCSTLTNQQVVAELGWTMQIIADKSGGYIPKYWRPPQGDIDNRVRAIAEEIFGLINVLWDHDTNDWCLDDQGGSYCPDTDPGKDRASVAAAAASGIHGPQDQGLIMLEHELTHASIGIFKDYYPSLKGLGWTPNNIPDLFNMSWYKNAWSNHAHIQNGSVIQTFTLRNSSSSTSTASSPTATSWANSNRVSSSTSQPMQAKTSVRASAQTKHINGAPGSSSVSLYMVAFVTIAAFVVTLLYVP